MIRRQKFWEGKKVFVTGHEGFLGSWLCKILIGKGADVVGLDKVKGRHFIVLGGLRKRMNCLLGDVTDLSALHKIVARHKPQVVFHLAAEAIVGAANDNSLQTFRSNIEGTWNILEVLKKKPFVEGIVVASSDKAYGSHRDLPYTEEHSLRGEHPYDVSKSCADLIANAYFRTFGLPVAITRCGNIYGPGEHNFSRIVPDCIKSLISGKPLLIRSDGDYTRDYVYIADIVNGYILLAENMDRLGLAGEAFNFSDEKPMTVIDIVRKICLIAGQEPCYKILDTAKHEIKHQCLSSKKARKLLGWKPEYSIEEGLKNSIDWYKNIFFVKKG